MTARLPRAPRLRRLATGPSPTWPRPVDALAERWARLPPRLRLAMIMAGLLVAATAGHMQVEAAQSRWGGDPVAVLTATERLPLGARVADGVRRTHLPPRAVPAGAVSEVDDDAVLAAPLARGAVLTDLHLDEAGPAAGLDDDLRVVPVAVREGWGVEAGGWVDVWVEGTNGAGGTAGAGGPVATSRPVLQVRGDGTRPTALIGLHVDEVAAVAAADRDAVRLTHAPPPQPAES
jgi:hypothetical protein